MKEGKDNITDGFKTRIGIRKIEFLGEKGFYLNNEPYEGKLMGANRHQDFAYVGNALSNSTHWRDVKKLKEAGVNVIRTAHYPQDPAFMDACDELGVFYIEATPGWQFWNSDPVFVNRAYQDIRNMIRRIRNRPCVLIWEPILNEAKYPVEFAKKANEIVKEEFPFPGCYTAGDAWRDTLSYADVWYNHIYKSQYMHKQYLKNNTENQKKYIIDYNKTKRCYFTREWGDCVDDFWNQNGLNRAHRSWGEIPQIVQALNLAKPDFLYTSYNNIYLTPCQHVGGCIWHSFDHQRGYFPDPFYGGIMDIFRQPKYSYYMFKSQVRPETSIAGKKVRPMVYIANEMTPFSPAEVVVFSNCDSVRLYIHGKPIGTIVTKNDKGMPYKPAIFKNAYRFYDVKALHRSGDKQGVGIVAEGIIGGKVVTRLVKKPALRPVKLQLEVDYEGMTLVADGSDFVVVVASIIDEKGNIKRLNNKQVFFEVSGEGELIGDNSIGANPRKIEWGTAPALVRSTTKPGIIKVNAHIDKRYFHTAREATVEIETVPPAFKLLFSEEYVSASLEEKMKKEVDKEQIDYTEIINDLKNQLQETIYELNKFKLKEVGKQQEIMEEGKD